jgi:hypothetical protein
MFACVLISFRSGPWIANTFVACYHHSNYVIGINICFSNTSWMLVAFSENSICGALFPARLRPRNASRKPKCPPWHRALVKTCISASFSGALGQRLVECLFIEAARQNSHLKLLDRYAPRLIGSLVQRVSAGLPDLKHTTVLYSKKTYYTRFL